MLVVSCAEWARLRYYLENTNLADLFAKTFVAELVVEFFGLIVANTDHAAVKVLGFTGFGLGGGRGFMNSIAFDVIIH